MPDRRVVDFGFFVRGGAVLDPAGQSGLTHFLEHALFRGAGERSGRELSRSVDARGGFVNAYTDKETLWIACEMLSEESDFALDLLADLVLRPTLPADQLARERDVILAEAESAREDGEERVRDLLDATLWSGSPYARPVVGLVGEVKALLPRDVAAHHARVVRPERSVLSVSGGFDPDSLREGIERRFSRWAGEGLSAVVPPSAPGLTARPVEEADLAQVHLGIVAMGVPRLDPQEPAVRVLATLLGGGASSRLFEHLREDRGLCYAVDASHAAYGDRGAFTLYLATSRSDLDRAAEAVRDELDRLAKGDVEDEEVERAKASLYGSLVAAEEHALERVERLAEETLFGSGPQGFEAAWQKIASVTVDEVRSVSCTLFGRRRARFVALGPVEEGWRPRRRTVA